MKRKGLVIVFTGDGKGKTSAALGIALRACGHRMRVTIVHFIKSPSTSGEEAAAQRLGPELEINFMGRGFVHEKDGTGEVADHRDAVVSAFRAVRQRVLSGFWDIVIMDEINVAVALGLIDAAAVVDLIRQKPEKLHLILTGRDAHPEIIAAADLVTEMRDVKHPFGSGIAAQQGIDF